MPQESRARADPLGFEEFPPAFDESRPCDIMISRRRMGQLVVRNLEDDVKARLRRRAARRGRSMEEEVRDILRDAVKGDEDAPPGSLGTAIASRFQEVGLRSDIPELRGHKIKPPSLR